MLRLMDVWDGLHHSAALTRSGRAFSRLSPPHLTMIDSCTSANSERRARAVTIEGRMMPDWVRDSKFGSGGLLDATAVAWDRVGPRKHARFPWRLRPRARSGRAPPDHENLSLRLPGEARTRTHSTTLISVISVRTRLPADRRQSQSATHRKR